MTRTPGFYPYRFNFPPRPHGYSLAFDVSERLSAWLERRDAAVYLTSNCERPTDRMLHEMLHVVLDDVTVGHVEDGGLVFQRGLRLYDLQIVGVRLNLATQMFDVTPMTEAARGRAIGDPRAVLNTADGAP
jgi:hypothetical protein